MLDKPLPHLTKMRREKAQLIEVEIKKKGRSQQQQGNPENHYGLH
jgi:hypothetical protein